jgi:peroxiredoxin
MMSVLMVIFDALSKPGLVLGGIGVLFIMLGCDSGYSKSPNADAPPPRSVAYQGRPSIGSPAPDFRLMDLHGKPVSLSDYQGKVVLLNFWATWCGPCRTEMPAMEALYRSMQPKGLEILAVSVDQQGTAVTRPFQEAMGLSFPILHDEDYQIGLTYGARTLPMTFAIDRRGVIRQLIFGARDWNSPEARRGIAEVLQEPIQEPSQRM